MAKLLIDRDLDFLKYCDTQDLQILVDYLTKDKNGYLRVSEGLTQTDAYKAFYPHSLQRMTDYISMELQHYGGNTIANMLRNYGVLYREILEDVAKRQKINFNSNNSTALIEQYLLQAIMEKAIDKMSEEELRQFLLEMNGGRGIGSKQAMTAVAITLIRSSGFTPYKTAVIVANALSRAIFKRGLSFVGNQFLNKSISIFSGPVGWAITGIWAIFDIASPAYRVTVPCVLHIAYMRLKYQNGDYNQASSYQTIPNRYHNQTNSYQTELNKYYNRGKVSHEYPNGGSIVKEYQKKEFLDYLEILLDNGEYKKVLNKCYREQRVFYGDYRFQTIKERASSPQNIEVAILIEKMEELLEAGEYEDVLRMIFNNEEKYKNFQNFQEIKERALRRY